MTVLVERDQVGGATKEAGHLLCDLREQLARGRAGSHLLTYGESGAFQLDWGRGVQLVPELPLVLARALQSLCPFRALLPPPAGGHLEELVDLRFDMERRLDRVSHGLFGQGDLLIAQRGAV